MDVRNCRKCGRLFNYIGGQPYCAACLNELEEVFKQVKEYIRSNETAGLKEVSEEFGVNQAIILRWVREERLEFAEHSEVGIDCESCGTTIKSGKYCHSCKEKLANTLASAYGVHHNESEHENRKIDVKMRYLK